jgi:hypothetical protein
VIISTSTSLVQCDGKLTELWLRPSLAEYVSTYPPRRMLSHIEADEPALRDSKHQVEIFQAASLCLFDEQEDKYKGNDIQESEEPQ